MLLRGYASYVALGGERGLALAGSGSDETGLRELARELGLERKVEFLGFLSAAEVSQTLAQALALVLVSREEQWGLVVNEALALGLPVIVSNEVGARDLLVRNLENGYVVESCDAEAIGRAMFLMGADEINWQAMSQASRERAELGDCSRLADALEALLFPECAEAWQRVRGLSALMEPSL